MSGRVLLERRKWRRKFLLCREKSESVSVASPLFMCGSWSFGHFLTDAIQVGASHAGSERLLSAFTWQFDHELTCARAEHLSIHQSLHAIKPKFECTEFCVCGLSKSSAVLYCYVTLGSNVEGQQSCVVCPWVIACLQFGMCYNVHQLLHYLVSVDLLRAVHNLLEFCLQRPNIFAYRVSSGHAFA